MLYTVIPTEMIFANEEGQTFQYEEVSLHNCTLQLQRSDKGYTVQRVISTDPTVYLNQEYQPGVPLSESRLSQLKELKD